MTQIEKLKKEISYLQNKYDNCTTRNVYNIGKKLRVKKAELNNLLLPQSVTNEVEAKQVIGYLVSVLGGGFHLDTPIADYVNIHTDEQTFTEAEISLLQPLLDQCFVVMGDEVYNYAMEVYCSNEATNLNID